MPPKRRTAASASASTLATLVTSVGTPKASAPDFSRSRTAAWSAGSSRSASTTLAPRAANALAIALPIPPAPPVITATRFLNGSMRASYRYGVHAWVGRCCIARTLHRARRADGVGRGADAGAGNGLRPPRLLPGRRRGVRLQPVRLRVRGPLLRRPGRRHLGFLQPAGLPPAALARGRGRIRVPAQLRGPGRGRAPRRPARADDFGQPALHRAVALPALLPARRGRDLVL